MEKKRSHSCDEHKIEKRQLPVLSRCRNKKQKLAGTTKRQRRAACSIRARGNENKQGHEDSEFPCTENHKRDRKRTKIRDKEIAEKG